LHGTAQRLMAREKTLSMRKEIKENRGLNEPSPETALNLHTVQRSGG
jgi:hypothetical protein